MKRNQINRASVIIILLLFINSCFNENALIDSVANKEVLLIINDENIQLGALSEVIELSEDQAVIFQVDEFIDKKIQPFEEVAELVERSLVNMQSKELLNKVLGK